MKTLFEYKGCGEIRQTHNIMQEMIDRKIAEMKHEVEYECRNILIAKGIADRGFTDYQWKRLARLMEGRSDGKYYYFNEHGEIPVYEVIYYEPPMPGWDFDRKPEDSYKINFGHYTMKAL